MRQHTLMHSAPASSCFATSRAAATQVRNLHGKHTAAGPLQAYTGQAGTQHGQALGRAPAGSPKLASCCSPALCCAAPAAAASASVAGPLLPLAAAPPTAMLLPSRGALRSVPSRPAPSGAAGAAPAGSIGDHSGAPSRGSAAPPAGCCAAGCACCCGVAAARGTGVAAVLAERAAAAFSGRPRGVDSGVSRPAEFGRALWGVSHDGKSWQPAAEVQTKSIRGQA